MSSLLCLDIPIAPLPAKILKAFLAFWLHALPKL